MNKGKYVFTQIMGYLPKKEFSDVVKLYNGNKRVRRFDCRDHFLSMSFGQLSHRNSLRDIVNCLSAHKSKSYHLGFKHIPRRSTLAEANENRPWKMYQEIAQILINQARDLYSSSPEFSLDLESTVYAFDSSTIDLCLSVFPWATFRKKKAGVKLHTLIDLNGNIPTFIDITEAVQNDALSLDNIPLETNAIYIMDRGYTDSTRLYDIHISNAFFIVRAKRNFKWKRLYSRPFANEEKRAGIRSDQIIKLTGELASGGYPEKIRRVTFFDYETKIRYVFWTNNFSLDPLTIAQLYKKRWEVELFFKWIKQHLEIKTFWGTSKNAIHTQIWVAISIYTLVAIIRKSLKLDKSIYEIIQILSVSLFDKIPLQSLLQNQYYNSTHNSTQISLF